MYDVMIIGGGPTGSAAAKTLAENGKIEKQKIPRYKLFGNANTKDTRFG